MGPGTGIGGGGGSGALALLRYQAHTITHAKAGAANMGKLPRPPTPSGVGVVLHAVVVVVAELCSESSQFDSCRRVCASIYAPMWLIVVPLVREFTKKE